MIESISFDSVALSLEMIQIVSVVSFSALSLSFLSGILGFAVKIVMNGFRSIVLS